MANGKFDLTKTLGESSYIYSRCEWSSSGSADTNKSTINVKVVVGKRSGSNSPTTCTFNTNVSVADAEYPSSQSSSPYASVRANQEIIVFEGTFMVPHENDGKKSTTINVSIGNNNVYHANGSSTITLDTIPRASSIAVSNYDLGQNISITIGKKVDSFTSTLTYKIGSRTGTIVEKTSITPYVWEMPEELIIQIKQDNPSNAKPSATIYCETYSGNTKIGDTKSATFNLYITDKPQIENVEIKETIGQIKLYTMAIVKHLSVPQLNVTAIPSEGTSVAKYVIKIGDREINSSSESVTVNNIQYSYLTEEGIRKTKFIVTVTDARGNVSDEYPVEMDFIEYVQLAFNNTDVKLTRLNGTSNFIKLHITGYIYNGLIGTTQNTLRIQYQYKQKNNPDAEWSDNKEIEATLNEDNTFIIDNLQLEDEFDYRENYEIIFFYADLFSTDYYSTVIKTSETTVKVHKNGLDAKNLTINKKQVLYEGIQDNYSTEEQIIGTWINGKPLYRTVIELPNGTGNTNEVKYTLSDYGISDVEEIYISNPSFYSLNENTYPFSYYDGNKFVALVSPTELALQLQYATISKSRVVITLEYTKTTDTVTVRR